MYKNLRDLFKYKYNEDQQSTHNRDRSIGKSVYHKHIDLKSKLNIKCPMPQTSRAPSSIKDRQESISPLGKYTARANDSNNSSQIKRQTSKHLLNSFLLSGDKKDSKLIQVNMNHDFNSQRALQQANSKSIYKYGNHTPKLSQQIYFGKGPYMQDITNQSTNKTNNISAIGSPKHRKSGLLSKQQSFDINANNNSALKCQQLSIQFNEQMNKLRNKLSHKENPVHKILQNFKRASNQAPSHDNLDKSSYLNSDVNRQVQEDNRQVSKKNFCFQFVIGRGGFGRVWKVQHLQTKKFYAMKQMSKSKVISKRSVSSVMNEQQLLNDLKHTFLVNMNCSFQDRDNLYLVMDLMTGGDLRYHVSRQQRFKENQSKFFVACIVLALEYLHKHHIIHRDLKPENIVLDHLGYAYLTDLGIARIYKQENSCDTSGTPGYMAPEVMCRLNHSYSVDFFALGVMVYEFMLGRRPYNGKSRNEIRDQILAKQAQIRRSELPDDYSVEAADFANRLLYRKATQRLGHDGIEELKQHPWLRDFQWDKLKKKELVPPFQPMSIDDNLDYREQISSEEVISDAELLRQNQIMLRRDTVQNLFAGYEKFVEVPDMKIFD